MTLNQDIGDVVDDSIVQKTLAKKTPRSSLTSKSFQIVQKNIDNIKEISNRNTELKKW